MRHLSVLVLALAGHAFAQEPNSWVYLDSAETASPPRLVLELEGGGSKVLTPSEDTVLIAYLADKAWPRLPQLSIDTKDQNRSLLRFEVPADLKVVKAKLVDCEPWSVLKIAGLPQCRNAELGIHRVRQPPGEDLAADDYFRLAKPASPT